MRSTRRLRTGRRAGLWLPLLAVLAACDAPPEPAPPDPPQAASGAMQARPAAGASRGAKNLVLITLDTTRADALNPYGASRVTSPRIDRMAREGVLFEQVASSSPSTLPSHATLLTGRFPPSHGVRSNAGYRLPAEIETLAEVLAARGFRTGAEIAAPILDASRGFDQGFARYRDLRAGDVERIRGQDSADGEERALDERPAEDITKGGMRFLDAHGSERFFLWLHYFDPHRFYVERPAWKSQIPDDGYLAEILYTDAQVGAFLDHLERLSLRDDTLVVLVADHGEGRGEHGESTHAFFLYESTIRVPLILWGPRGLPAGRRITSLVRTADVMPTALELLELPTPRGVEGRSLVPLVQGRSEDLSLTAYGESVEFAMLFDGAPLRYLRRGPWKYIHQVEPELYDLSRDPRELENLAAQHPEKLASLRAELEARVGDAMPSGASRARVGPEEQAQLAQLGYLVAGGSELSDERLASLELHGRPPAELAADVERFAESQGALKLGRAEQAAAGFEELLSRHPHSAPIRQEYAEALVALGRSADARRAYRQVIAASGCGAKARIGLAALLKQAGERAAELEVLREGVARCEAVPELLNNCAFLLATGPDAALRDGAEAVHLAERALSIARESPEILDTLAAAQAEAGDFEAASATLHRALRAARAEGRPAALASVLEGHLALVEAGLPIRDE